MKRSLPVLLALPMLLVTACGDDSPASSSSSGGLTKITVANAAVTNSASLVLGVEKGFFRAEGLDVKLKDTPPASTQAAVVSGDAQFGFTNVPAILVGASNGLPVRIVGPAGKFARDKDKTHIQVVVPKGSSITSVKDLEGKKVAVDTLYQLPHLSFIVSARKSGVDTDGIKFVETPFSAMADALAKGQVDAADLAEPFLTAELQKGGRSVLSNGHGFEPETVQTMWITSASYLSGNKATVDKFTRALKKSNEYAAAHDADVRQATTTYTKTSEEQSKKLLMPHFSPTTDRENFQTYLATMKDLKVIKKDVDLDELFID
ncbi:ABC transporter substrate-binding protein [Streptomyces sp. NPDC059785]|uniref:ABC transporter substrate-binding protein n=1 Tax=Streptomyces sp. NPDC059785 TaxID=3346945 RepID=UPI00364F24CC